MDFLLLDRIIILMLYIDNLWIEIVIVNIHKRKVKKKLS